MDMYLLCVSFMVIYKTRHLKYDTNYMYRQYENRTYILSKFDQYLPCLMDLSIYFHIAVSFMVYFINDY
jgi:hypothetical protein